MIEDLRLRNYSERADDPLLPESPRADAWEGLVGFADPDSLRRALKWLRISADDVERLLSGVIGKALPLSPSEHALLTNLRSLADRVEKAVQVITPSRNLTSRAARADIVRHVEDRTLADLTTGWWPQFFIPHWVATSVPKTSGVTRIAESSSRCVHAKTKDPKICPMVLSIPRSWCADLAVCITLETP